MERITGLWKNQMKNGKHFLSGSFLGLRIVILPNMEKKDRQPDYHLFLEVKEPIVLKENKEEQPVVTEEDL